MRTQYKTQVAVLDWKPGQELLLQFDTCSVCTVTAKEYDKLWQKTAG